MTSNFRAFARALDRAAGDMLAEPVLRDRTLKRRMTRAEVKEAQRRSREWLDAHPR